MVYGLNGTAVNILCKAEIAVDYCWFMHPLGQRISVSDRLTANMAAMATGEDNNWSYYGAGLRMGECGVTVREATLEDTGLWQCHLGTVRPTGWETSRTVSVRVSGEFVYGLILGLLIGLTFFDLQNLIWSRPNFKSPFRLVRR